MSDEQTVIQAAEYKHAPAWEKLVTEGHVWHARLETLVQPARKLQMAALALAFVGFSSASSIAGWYTRGNSQDDYKEAIAEAVAFKFEPQFKLATPSVLSKISNGEVNFVKPNDLMEFVLANSSSLIKSQVMAHECIEVKSFKEPLADDINGPDVPRCKTIDDRIWVAAGVYDTDRGTSIGWLGLFKKTDDKKNPWRYYNVSGMSVEGFETLTPGMIRRTLAKDIPEFVVTTERAE